MRLKLDASKGRLFHSTAWSYPDTEGNKRYRFAEGTELWPGFRGNVNVEDSCCDSNGRLQTIITALSHNQKFNETSSKLAIAICRQKPMRSLQRWVWKRIGLAFR